LIAWSVFISRVGANEFAPTLNPYTQTEKALDNTKTGFVVQDAFLSFADFGFLFIVDFSKAVSTSWSCNRHQTVAGF